MQSQYDDEWLEASLRKLNLSKLKKKCEKLSISSKGSKKELISRIMTKVSHTYANKTAEPEYVSKEWIPNENNYKYKASFSSGVYGTYPSIPYDPNSNNAKSTKQIKQKDKVYTKSELQQLSKSDLSNIIQSYSKSELINIIISRQNKKQKKVDEQLKKRNAHKDTTNKMFSNAHEKNIKPVNFGERMATDYDKIEKQRTIIRQLKEKRKGQNDLKARNAARNAGLFSDAHEKVIKHKEIKHPKPKKKKNNNKEKIMDVVSREMIEQREHLKETKDGKGSIDEDDNISSPESIEDDNKSNHSNDGSAVLGNTQ